MLDRLSEVVIPFSAEQFSTLLRYLLPGYIILIPFLDVIGHFASEFNFLGFVAEFYLVSGLLVSIFFSGIHELYSLLKNEGNKWKKNYILKKFVNGNERRQYLSHEYSPTIVVRLYKHLQDKFLAGQHEEAHLLTSYMFFLK
jgi:hypothetical protein